MFHSNFLCCFLKQLERLSFFLIVIFLCLSVMFLALHLALFCDHFVNHFMQLSMTHHLTITDPQSNFEIFKQQKKTHAMLSLFTCEIVSIRSCYHGKKMRQVAKGNFRHMPFCHFCMHFWYYGIRQDSTTINMPRTRLWVLHVNSIQTAFLGFHFCYGFLTVGSG